LVVGSSLAVGVAFAAPQPPKDQQLAEPWLKPIPVPFDLELEEQIAEVQEAIGTLHQQMVRRKEAIKQTPDGASKAKLYDDLEALRQERGDLEAILRELVDEAKASEQTAIDEALARARWLERQQEYWDQKEELLRDRQE